MASVEILRPEISSYLILADQLKAQYGEIDDETLQDTLEGISDLPDLIQEVIRSSLEDEALVTGLKERLGQMQERLARLQARREKKRALACWAMGSAQIDKLQAPDFSVSIRQGPPHLEIVDETTIPEEFYVPQPARLDRIGLTTALKRGQVIQGAQLAQAEPSIAVRVR